MTPVMLILIAVATARLTRLVTTDVLTAPLRDPLVRWLAQRGAIAERLAYLVVCDWCASVYMGAAVTGAWWAWGETIWYTAALTALTASYVTGFLASKTEG